MLKQNPAEQSGLQAQGLALELPTSVPRGSVCTASAANHPFELPSCTVQQLKDLARAQRCKLYQVVLAAWGLHLCRHSGQETVVVGCAVSKTVKVFCVRAQRDGSLREMLQSVSEAIPGVNIDTLQTKLNWNDEDAELDLCEISLTVWSSEEFELCCRIDYSTKLFTAGSIRSMAERFQTLSQSLACSDIHSNVWAMPLINLQENACLHSMSQGPVLDVPPVTIHELVIQMTHRRPHLEALEWQGATMTYEELRTHAQQVAAWLNEHGVISNTIVALQIDRSLEQVRAWSRSQHENGRSHRHIPLSTPPLLRLARRLSASLESSLPAERICPSTQSGLSNAVCSCFEIPDANSSSQTTLTLRSWSPKASMERC